MESLNTQGNGPRVDFGVVTVSKVMTGMSETSDIAVLTQPTTTIYPAATAGNDKTDSLFDTTAFGDGQSYISSRNAIIKVPKNATAEEVAVKIAACPKPHIYRELSFNIEDVLTDNQLSMLAQGKSSKTLAEYKEDKAVKSSEDGTKVLIDGKVQYRSLYFAKEFKADVDYREVAAEPVRAQIASEELASIVVEPTEADIKVASQM